MKSFKTDELSFNVPQELVDLMREHIVSDMDNPLLAESVTKDFFYWLITDVAMSATALTAGALGVLDPDNPAYQRAKKVVAHEILNYMDYRVQRAAALLVAVKEEATQRGLTGKETVN